MTILEWAEKRYNGAVAALAANHRQLRLADRDLCDVRLGRITDACKKRFEDNQKKGAGR